MRASAVAAVFLLGAGAGGAATWLLLPTPPSPAPSGEARRSFGADDGELGRLRRELEEARAAAARAGAGPVVATPSAPTGPEPAAARGDPAVAARAEEIRREALRTGANAVQIAEAQVKSERRAEARRSEQERRQTEDAARGGTMDLLRGLEKNWVAPWDLLSSPEGFGTHFARRVQGATYDGATTSLKDPLPDGSELVFPAGRFLLDVDAVNQWKSAPTDLLVTGQGRDATLLEFSKDIRLNGDVRSLTFRDLTLNANDHYLEAMRSGPYTLRLERCRVVGFDMGSGGSSMLNGSVGGFYASDCRIEAGYGKSPGSGKLFDVRGALVARLERCVLRGPFRSVTADGRAAVLYRECVLEDLRLETKGEMEKPPPGTRFEECTFAYREEGAPAVLPVTRKSLADINPAWGTEKAAKK